MPHASIVVDISFNYKLIFCEIYFFGEVKKKNGDNRTVGMRLKSKIGDNKN